MKYVTEMDTRAPELRRTLEATRRALPGAEARARMYEQAGTAANSDYAASASAAYGLAAATVEACEQMLAQLDDSRPYWEVILPTASGEDGISAVYHDDSRLYAYYPSGRVVRLRARLSDLCDFAIVQVEAEDGRSLGSGHIRESARAAAWEAASRPEQKMDRAQHERETWFTWRTDAAHGGLWADSADEALATLVREGEWAEPGSAREARYIADGAWLTIFEDGVPVLRRGLMP